MKNEFHQLCREFSHLADAYSSESFFVYVLPPSAMRAHKPSLQLLNVWFYREVKILGHGRLANEKVSFGGLASKGRQTACKKFVELATLAGKFVPREIIEQSGFTDLDSPFSNWMAIMWQGCKPKHGLWFDPEPEPDFLDDFGGWTWCQPFSDAIVAAGTLGLIGPDQFEALRSGRPIFVDMTECSAWLRNTRYSLTPEQAIILKELEKAGGTFVAGAKTGVARADRVIKNMPAELRRLVQSRDGRNGGFRLIVFD